MRGARRNLAPDIGRTAAIGCSIAGCVCLCLTNGAARRSEYRAIAALFAGGLFIGIGPPPPRIGRGLSVLLAATLITALGTVLISTAGADRACSIAWITVFGGFTAVDFNLMRRAGVQDVVPLAAGVFLDILNIFLALLDLLDSDAGS